jgi:putative nucleotide binding protein
MEGNNMQPRRTGAGREDVDPLEGEEWARVLEHSGSGVIFAVSENKLHLIRLRERPGAEKQIIGSRVYFGSDVNQRGAIAEPLGMTRYRDLSNMSKSNLSVVIAEIIADLPDAFLSFFNRAGNLSLKMHAFELLSGIGPSKAREMVGTRGRKGWKDIASLDSSCSIDSATLLAERMTEEISDSKVEPRLVDLLLRQEV